MLKAISGLLAELAKRCIFLLDFFLLVMFPISGTAFERIKRHDCCSFLLWGVRRLGRGRGLMGKELWYRDVCLAALQRSIHRYLLHCLPPTWVRRMDDFRNQPPKLSDLRFREFLPQSISGFTQIHQQYYARGDRVMDRTHSKESVSFSSATREERHHPLDAGKHEAKGCFNETKPNGSKPDENQA